MIITRRRERLAGPGRGRPAQPIPAVAEVAVAGRPDPEWGQRVVAWVVPVDPAADPARRAARPGRRTSRPLTPPPASWSSSTDCPAPPIGKVRAPCSLPLTRGPGGPVHPRRPDLRRSPRRARADGRVSSCCTASLEDRHCWDSLAMSLGRPRLSHRGAGLSRLLPREPAPPVATPTAPRPAGRRRAGPGGTPHGVGPLRRRRPGLGARRWPWYPGGRVHRTAIRSLERALVGPASTCHPRGHSPQPPAACGRGTCCASRCR